MKHTPGRGLRAGAVVGVGALYLHSDGTFLIGRRIKAGEPTTWCLPGGHLEAGESFEAAALRELHEEAGIDHAGDGRVFAVAIDTSSRNPHVTVGVVIEADHRPESVVSAEPDVFDLWSWAPLSAPPGPLFPASRALLETWSYGECRLPGWTAYPIPPPHLASMETPDPPRPSSTRPSSMGNEEWKTR